MEEFKDVLTELKVVLEAKKQEAGLRRNEQWILCLDHARAHNQAAAVLGSGMQLLPHPPHSPDCNKPVEHIHGQLDAMMKTWLSEWREQQPTAHPTPQLCKDTLVNFFKSISTQSIADDVATLPDTWQAIVDELGGFISSRLS
jgi:hypothetical protein